MSARQILVLTAAITTWSLSACTYTFGECWRRGERGEGSEGAGAGFGEGDVISSGASGDFGATPDGEPLECNETEESSEESPKDNPESPPERHCQGVGNTTGDGTIFWICSDECSSMCPVAEVNGFSPSIFKFVTTIPSDGTVSGWQVAVTTLKFERLSILLPEVWECSVTVGVPLWTTEDGIISPEYAATISADAADIATKFLMHNPPGLPPGIFCAKLPDTMTAAFKAKYKSIGARATKQ